MTISALTLLAKQLTETLHGTIVRDSESPNVRYFVERVEVEHAIVESPEDYDEEASPLTLVVFEVDPTTGQKSELDSDDTYAIYQGYDFTLDLDEKTNAIFYATTLASRDENYSTL